MHSTDLSDKMHGISSQQYNWSYVNSKNSWTQLVIGFESSQFMFIRLGWTEPPKVNTRRQGTSARMALATNNRHTEEGSIKLQTTDALIGCKCSMTLLLDWTNCFVTVHWQDNGYGLAHGCPGMGRNEGCNIIMCSSYGSHWIVFIYREAFKRQMGSCTAFARVIGFQDVCRIHEK